MFAEFPWIFLVCKYNGQGNDWKGSVLFWDWSRKKDRLRVELPEETADISWFTTGFPAKWRHSVEISTLFTCHYPELGSAYDGLSQTKFASGNAKHYPVLRSDALTSFRRETIGVVSRPFSQATYWISTLTVYFSALSGRLDTQPLWFLLQNIFQRTGLELSKFSLRRTGIKSCYSELTG